MSLKIAVPASIQSIEDQFVVELRNTSLICNASGTPQPTVFWINVASGQRTNSSVLVRKHCHAGRSFFIFAKHFE